MKNAIKIIAIGVAGLLSAGANAQVKDQRNVEHFNAVLVKGSFDVVLKKADKEAVVIESKSKAADYIKTEVNDGTLKISTNGNSFNSSDDNLKITVYYQKLDGIKNQGSANINCSEGLDAKNDEIKIEVQGSGNINVHNAEGNSVKVIVAGSGNLNIASINSVNLKLSVAGSGDLNVKSIKATSVKASIAGSGDIRLSGKTIGQEIKIAGSGDVHAFDLLSDSCTVSIAGSGDAKINVSTVLDASVVGSGDVAYKGNAKISKFYIKGSGDIRKAD